MEISRLSEIDPRAAWSHEALDFTPWLAANIDHLSEVVGVELELVGQEMAVESFSADILAQDSVTGHRVLIENQLERSDHGHLGQIMTYLAGLDARIVIWIAPRFTSAHLSALKWLNEHTPDDFAFFAVSLRVVRIGDSPVAPIFEVQARPDTWARAVNRQASSAEAERTVLREQFWSAYLRKYPEKFAPTRLSNVWLPLTEQEDVVLSMYVAIKSCGMFLRGARGQDRDLTAAFFEKHAQFLESALGVAKGDGTRNGHFFVDSRQIPLDAKDRWDEAIDWMEKRARDYSNAIAAL